MHRVFYSSSYAIATQGCYVAKFAIEAEELSIALGGKEIVKNASLQLPYGELRVIAGPNGAGKSTLLRAILGLIEIQHGTIKTDGKRLTSLSHEERARHLSYVPQTSGLSAALRVSELVAQARFARSESRSRTREAVDVALAKTGMQSFADRSYLELSGGEKRLALIARALCTEARSIILDEPTACLDIANRLRVLGLLRTLAAEGYGVLAVLHDLDDVSNYADHMTLLRDGLVTNAGTPKSVLTAETVREVYGVELSHNAALGFRLIPEVGP